MKTHILIAALAAASSLIAGQANAAPEDESAGSADSHLSMDQDSLEAGTIPAAPPGLPSQEKPGAAGPVRTDSQTRTDPSVRDTHPLTVNGLWEMLPNNAVATTQNRLPGSVFE